MMVNTENLVAMTDMSQDFAKVAQMVDESGMAVILKNDEPRYILVNYDEYDELKTARRKLIIETAENIIDENLETFLELAK